MQSRRTARTRASATNENAADENSAAITTRVTRAKAASLTTSKGTALATKQTNTIVSTTVTNNRKRAALGDVSNVHKPDNGAAGDKKVTKKPVASKITATSKTATNGVTKTRSTRPASKAVAPKEAKRKEPVASTAARKRPAPTTSAPIKEENEVEEGEEENVPPAPSDTAVPEEPKVEEENTRAAKRPRVESKTKTDEEHQSASAVEGWDDLDAEDAEDPLMVSEYVNEIFEYLRKLEPDTQPNPDYMESQKDIQWKMRGILVDWLIEVHTRFRLLPETLFLAVNIIDRFLSNKVVMLDKLQLVGVAAMFVAAKYEEVFSPHVQYFRHVADDGFTEDEILKAERYILATLDYNLSYPNPMNFLRRISKADQYDFQTRTFAKYLMEISLLDHRFIEYKPSHVAAAAMYLSRMMLDRGSWDANLAHFSDYTEEDIMPVFRLMINYLIQKVPHEAFYKKYASKKFMKASLHARQWAKRNAETYGVELGETDLYGENL